MKVLGIIPARYASTRFPGKPLVHIKGKSMIQRVYERAKQAIDNVVVATDDARIRNHVLDFGGNAILTSNKHRSGTDRCAEALELIADSHLDKFDVVVNIQGDEPLISIEAISQLISAFEDNEIQIATLVNKVRFSQQLENKNIVKVFVDARLFARYFSRSLIPFVRNEEDLPRIYFYKHIGIYAYKPEILMEITKLEPTNFEIAESLEQNRWLENGYSIKAVITRYESIGVDTPKDLEKVLKILQKTEK